MRELGFAQNWGGKLDKSEFTTFRYKRKDRDWRVNEVVRVVIRPRSKDRQVLGAATIVTKEERLASEISDDEAVVDGFKDRYEMQAALLKMHGQERYSSEVIYKYTLRWTREAM